jgi:O-antigen/teichoic acid export membrane protein
MSEITKTVKYAGIYAIGIFLGKSVSFLMLPIYTRFLSPKNYGTIELLTMTVDIFAMVVGLGLNAAVFRFYYKYENEKDRFKVISTIVILMIGLYAIGSTAGILSSQQLSDLVLADVPEGSFYFKLIFITFFFQSFTLVPLLFIKAQQRPVFFVSVSIARLMMQLSLNIYFVIFLKLQVLGVLYGTLLTQVAIGTFLLIYTFKNVGFHFSKKLATSLIAFGAPLIFANFGDFILTFSDRYFLRAYSDLSTVGIYSLGYKLGFILWLFPVRPIMDIWEAQRFEIVGKPNSDEINKKIFFFYNLLLISFALGISMFSLDLFRVMSHASFWDAYKIVPIIMIAYIIQAWTVFVNFGVVYGEKTRYIAFATVSAAITILILSFILIPRYHEFGAAIATVIAFFVRFSIIYYFSEKIIKLSLPWDKCIIMLVLAIAAYLCSISFQQSNVALSIGMNSAIFCVYIGAFFVFPVFNENEKRTLLSVIRNPIKSIKSGGING